jgi:gamma-glutamylcyclotransferase (GGCT)/AIG2-like uncharacterized protein YtfP
MCLIIIKKSGLKLPKDAAMNAALINPDGLGIVWLDTYEVSYHKSKHYKLLETDRPFIAHFRYATVGAVGKDNTHPFKCGKNENEYLMQNGTIKGLGDAKVCDSKVLAQAIGEMPRQKWKSELSKYDSRFVTVNVRNKSFQVYNKELWTQKDGVWYSKDNIFDDNLVAVYGTLKRDYSNYWSYLVGSRFVGSGNTVEKYPLLVGSLPYLIDEVGTGHNVSVDVFAVTDSKLKSLDVLEGHPNWYQRRQRMVNVGGKEMLCWIYFNLREKVKADSVLHQSYTEGKKSFKKWNNYYDVDYSYRSPIIKPVEKKIITERTVYFEDVLEAQVDDAYEKYRREISACPHCYRDVKYDLFSHYYCDSCCNWFKDDEVVRFNP